MGWIANSADGYLEIAAALAASAATLATLRRSLRARMTASPLCDGPAFAAKVEDACRAIWRRWCEEEAVRQVRS
jgi:predicted O-linked N-acetylglucosamine transferase (SPINDLY family)